MTVVVVALAATLAACGDDPTDPASVLASAEAEAVMRSASALPSLPELVDRVDGATPPPTAEQRITLYRARELWDAGVASERGRGDARRRLAVAYAAPVLAVTFPEPALGEVRARIENWHATAEGMLRHIAMPEVQGRLLASRRQLDRSDGSADRRARIYHLLLASSELVETTPRFVARDLARQADAVVRRVEARAAAEGAASETAAPPPAESLERARRLTDWAARAVEEEEYLLAIQRAYYAIQLAEGR